MWVDHMVDHFNTYLCQKRGFFYCSRRVLKEVQQCHSKQRIVLALNTRSRAKALKYSQVICHRLDERWLVIRKNRGSYGEGHTIGSLRIYLSRLVLDKFVSQQTKNRTD